ncbi:hypothetical protein ACIBEA_06710 [Streptomyces sp. NPDC051555]|uniref:hypothetical protein n=1 Tax=Streptomyces sp. NPDC051555 TaxID=3365657 RepID=UPI0037A107CD
MLRLLGVGLRVLALWVLCLRVRLLAYVMPRHERLRVPRVDVADGHQRGAVAEVAA